MAASPSRPRRQGFGLPTYCSPARSLGGAGDSALLASVASAPFFRAVSFLSPTASACLELNASLQSAWLGPASQPSSRFQGGCC
ncbi:hypothetical protein GQ55_2G019600 [Panicum hallii var. hallii]|uniref:Uncharacterized protein n=1 Tax=Panicum hallii var. hallii TaxID=1504633 RepID=A0A2T7EKI1_9POAL|nr:hypothetical protein GQ55_2G019600 [Panicum hallii var. hallii]